MYLWSLYFCSDCTYFTSCITWLCKGASANTALSHLIPPISVKYVSQKHFNSKLGDLHVHQLSQVLANRGLGTANQLSKATEQLGKFLGPDVRPDLLVGLQNCHHKGCPYGLQGQYLAHWECHSALFNSGNTRVARTKSQANAEVLRAAGQGSNQAWRAPAPM